MDWMDFSKAQLHLAQNGFLSELDDIMLAMKLSREILRTKLIDQTLKSRPKDGDMFHWRLLDKNGQVSKIMPLNPDLTVPRDFWFHYYDSFDQQRPNGLAALRALKRPPFASRAGDRFEFSQYVLSGDEILEGKVDGVQILTSDLPFFAKPRVEIRERGRPIGSTKYGEIDEAHLEQLHATVITTNVDLAEAMRLNDTRLLPAASPEAAESRIRKKYRRRYGAIG